MRAWISKFPTAKGSRELAFLVALGTLLVLYGQAGDTPRLSPSQANAHLGEVATVCGRVVDAKTSRYSVGNLGKPITFFLDSPQSNPEFSFAAWTPDSDKLSRLKESYEGKRVCVTGKIIKLAKVPHITATDLSEIEVQRDPTK